MSLVAIKWLFKVIIKYTGLINYCIISYSVFVFFFAKQLNHAARVQKKLRHRHNGKSNLSSSQFTFWYSIKLIPDLMHIH